MAWGCQLKRPKRTDMFLLLSAEQNTAVSEKLRALIEGMTADGTLLRRSHRQMAQHICSFLVAYPLAQMQAARELVPL